MKDFDPDIYRSETAELGLSETQQNELLGILWSIMKGFVELGWGVDSIQISSRGLMQNASENEPNDVEFARHRTIEKEKAVALIEPPELGDS
jgi:hypothetical protein